MHPLHITIYDDRIYLKCILFHKSFYYRNISSIKRISDISGIRRFGSNGVWGYIGIIDSTEKYYTICNNLKNLIAVKYNKKTYVLNCSNPEQFIDNINTLKKSII